MLSKFIIKKKFIRIILISIATLFFASCDDFFDEEIKFCNSAVSLNSAPTMSQIPTQASDFVVISPLPLDLSAHYCLDMNYYKKVTWVHNVPIAAPEDVSSIALQNISELVYKQLEISYSLNENIAPILFEKRFRIGVYPYGSSLLSQQLPEYKQFPPASGYGATSFLTMMAVGEREGAFGIGGATLVHEISHVLHLIAYNFIDSNFQTELEQAYNEAESRNIWDTGAYIRENEEEYLAEGTEMFFSYFPADISRTQEELLTISPSDFLKERDPTLFNLLTKLYDSTEAQNLKSTLSFHKGLPSIDLIIRGPDNSDINEVSYIDRIRLEFIDKNNKPDPLYPMISSLSFIYTGMGYLLQNSIPDPRSAVAYYVRDVYRFRYLIDTRVYATCEISKNEIIQISMMGDDMIDNFCQF